MRYAYLIIANRNHRQLQKLISMLDDSRNDIYLMVDKKSNNFPLNFRTNWSALNYLRPINIYWGSYTQIQAEINLLKASISEHYTYYHLLSGLDLPLVNQDIIHNFFDNNLNKEFIKFNHNIAPKRLIQRTKHHLFRKNFRTNNIFIKVYRKFEGIFLRYLDGSIPLDKIVYGSNWFTIDDMLAQFIIKKEYNIFNAYKYGCCVDEIFIPVLLNYYPLLKKRLYSHKLFYGSPNDFQSNLRYIDWWDTWGSSPYIWKLKDYNTLLKARKEGYLFSRKFDDKVDSNIINKIFDDVMNS